MWIYPLTKLLAERVHYVNAQTKALEHSGLRAFSFYFFIQARDGASADLVRPPASFAVATELIVNKFEKEKPGCRCSNFECTLAKTLMICRDKTGLSPGAVHRPNISLKAVFFSSSSISFLSRLERGPRNSGKFVWSPPARLFPSVLQRIFLSIWSRPKRKFINLCRKNYPSIPLVHVACWQQSESQQMRWLSDFCFKHALGVSWLSCHGLSINSPCRSMCLLLASYHFVKAKMY